MAIICRQSGRSTLGSVSAMNGSATRCQCLGRAVSTPASYQLFRGQTRTCRFPETTSTMPEMLCKGIERFASIMVEKACQGLCKADKLCRLHSGAKECLVSSDTLDGLPIRSVRVFCVRLKPNPDVWSCRRRQWLVAMETVIWASLYYVTGSCKESR
jgi:hypothetical protein